MCLMGLLPILSVAQTGGTSIMVGTSTTITGKISTQTESDPKLHFGIGTETFSDFMVVNSSGMVGIGNSVSPVEKLHVQGNMYSEGNLIFQSGSTKGIVFADGSKIVSLSDIGTQLAASGLGDSKMQTLVIGTGTVPTNSSFNNYKLAVNGKIVGKQVCTNQDTWADYVFMEDYPLPSLPEVKKYIAEHGHLKDIPSAQEVKESGLDLGEMNKLLLQKIEELSLYVIQLKEEVDGLKKSSQK